MAVEGAHNAYAEDKLLAHRPDYAQQQPAQGVADHALKECHVGIVVHAEGCEGLRQGYGHHQHAQNGRQHLPPSRLDGHHITLEFVKLEYA